jgi:hypothetical protein
MYITEYTKKHVIHICCTVIPDIPLSIILTTTDLSALNRVCSRFAEVRWQIRTVRCVWVITGSYLECITLPPPQSSCNHYPAILTHNSRAEQPLQHWAQLQSKAIPVTGCGGQRVDMSRHILLDDGSQIVVRLSALRNSRPLPPGRFLVPISVRDWVDPRAIVQLQWLG